MRIPLDFAVGFLVCTGLLFGLSGCRQQTPPPPPAAITPTLPGRSPVQAPPPSSTIEFTDVTGESGIDFTYQNGRETEVNSILESLGGGVGLIDFDLDGRLDVFFPGGGFFRGREILGQPSVLYRNLGAWKFANVSRPSGGGFAAVHYTHGCFGADYDNDGFTDVLITGYGGLQLWKNQGDGTFLEIGAELGLIDPLWSSAAGWGDVNGDGALDLYVANYVDWSFDNHPLCTALRPDQIDICPPKVFGPLPDILFISNGDGTFRNASEEAGLRKDGKGLGVVLGDLDLDGDTDIYVANDTTDNFLYLNDGNTVFREEAAIRGVAADDRGAPNGSMGVDIGDFNLDGLPDLWVANFEVESFALYRNEGRAQFLHVSRATGVTALNGLFVGFGTAFADLDRDGDEDLVVTNGHVINYPRIAPLLQEPLVLLNSGGRQFHRLSWPDSSYLGAAHAGRGLALGDIDEDGDLDLVFANNHEPAALLRNDSRDKGQSIRLRLIGRKSNRDAIGAVAVLDASSGRQMRMVKGGASYLSQSEYVITWGMAADQKASQVTIRWPEGGDQAVQLGPKTVIHTAWEP